MLMAFLSKIMGLNLHNMLNSTLLGYTEVVLLLLFWICAIIWCFCQVMLHDIIVLSLG